MRIQDNGDSIALWVSANDTYDWAHKTGAAWPCSTLSGHRFAAAFDTNGLCDLTVDGRSEPHGDFDGHEFSAICADMLATKLSSDHPCYFVTVGQFVATS